ncbi:MAG: TolC family protein [Flavobacteriia bacterium]|nr:TolC family protein [Flavobacteriia bacterium]
MNKIIQICSSALFLLSVSAYAQDPAESIGLNQGEFLSLDSAITIAIKNNHGIAIARNNTQIAANNARPGVSGLYPTLTVNGGATLNNNDSEIEFVTGETQNVDGAQSLGTNANVTLSYTVFDGLRNWNAYRQAQTLEDAAVANQRLTVENTLVSVIAQYYEVARQTQNFGIAQEAITISLDRYNRAELRKELGAGVTLDLLNAEVDLNRDSVNFRSAGTQLLNAKRTLSVLMGLNPTTDFTVETEVQFSSLLTAEQFKSKALQQNAALIAARRNQRASDYAVSAANGQLFSPVISVNGGYGFNRQDSEAGFLVSNQATGWNVGVNLRWNLWDGQASQTRRDNARLQAENARSQVLNTEQQLAADIENAYTTYVNALYILRTEERNLETSKLNFERTRESFALGQVTNTTYREAQLNYLRSEAALLNATYVAKVAEVRLLQLSGILLDDNS